ncbi:F5/8 type C domain-containing protein [Paenibacillus polysaccharolyticus]|uniref:F5/8 type C domain-containing protein n=1 Tax=Paenibacillus polysaccharolyticus TaxID=582692 RepID=A0A1G5I8Z0_9BACL|nr:SPRY domain-containing protein [Paenibacillus polysaccharolyticus]SCY72110.1 F5/8 type C domain-containing protein [Paenibacillus polysaccharolyticus]
MESIPVTLNPNDTGSGFTLSNGNLTFVSATDYRAIRATHGKSYGKWYWEVRYDAGVRNVHIGISNKQFSLSGNFVPDSTNWRTYYGNTGNKYPENTTYSTVWDVGNVIGVALDLDNGTLEFYKNSVSMEVSHTNIKLLGEVFPTLGSFSGSSKTVSINFGATPFVYSVPSGFKAYNLKYSYKLLISTEDQYQSIEEVGYINAIPKMTSNTSANPIAPIYSGEFINGPATGQGYAYQAFDGNVGTSACPTNNPLYIGIDFHTPTNIQKYSISSSASSGNLPSTAWVFEASNDNTVWVNLDTKASITWSPSSTKEYETNNSKKYRFYRIRPTVGGTYFYSEIKMMIYQPPIMKVLSDGADFIKHGMNKDQVLYMDSEISTVKFVKTNSENLGSGKVFKQKINTTKIPIKKASIT